MIVGDLEILYVDDSPLSFSREFFAHMERLNIETLYKTNISEFTSSLHRDMPQESLLWSRKAHDFNKIHIQPWCIDFIKVNIFINNKSLQLSKVFETHKMLYEMSFNKFDGLRQHPKEKLKIWNFHAALRSRILRVVLNVSKSNA